MLNTPFLQVDLIPYLLYQLYVYNFRKIEIKINFKLYNNNFIEIFISIEVIKWIF